TMSRNRSDFHGSAAPPPLRVTFGTGQPKFMSMWSARSSATSIVTASRITIGSTPYSWMLRGDSDSWWRISRIVFGVRSTRARVVIISLTYRPAPYSRHRRRNAVFVIPAIGASTTGTSSSIGPRRRLVCVARAVTYRFSQIEVALMPGSERDGLEGRTRVDADAFIASFGATVADITEPVAR